MTLLETMAREIVDACLPVGLIDDDDRALVRRHRDLLLSIEDDLIAAFFDAASAQERTARIVERTGRDRLEATLRRWWQQTVTGGLGEDYLRWMALAGIVHVREGVSSTMTLAMLQVLRDVFSRGVMLQLDTAEASALARSLSNVQTTVGALVSEASTRAQALALTRASGLRPALLEGIVAKELGAMVDQASAWKVTG